MQQTAKVGAAFVHALAQMDLLSVAAPLSSQLEQVYTAWHADKGKKTAYSKAKTKLRPSVVDRLSNDQRATAEAKVAKLAPPARGIDELLRRLAAEQVVIARSTFEQ